MKTLTFERPHNLKLLHEELLEAMPELRGQMKVRRREGQIVLVVPDDADEDAVRAVVDAHDETGLSRNERVEKRKKVFLQNLRQRVRNNPGQPATVQDLWRALRLIRGELEDL